MQKQERRGLPISDMADMSIPFHQELCAAILAVDDELRLSLIFRHY